MAIIRLEPNKPRQITLKYKSAKEKPSRSGIGMEYLYTLDNGDGLFLPPVAHAEIQSLHVEAGEPFVLLKTEATGTITWTVERIPQPGPKLVKGKTKAELLNELEHHKGIVSKEDARALVLTVFIQLTPRPQANGTRG